MNASQLALKSVLVLFVGLLLPFACGGDSNFSSESDGDAGEPASGGSSSGGGGQGGSLSSGGTSGTSSGGASGSGTGGSATGGDGSGGVTSGSGGGGTGGGGTGGSASGGTSGASTGGSGNGGSAGTGTGGFAGQGGGSGGSGGGADERCPLMTPSGTCEYDGLTCRYDLARMCLCSTVQSSGVCTPDPRCMLSLDQPERIIPDGGGAIPVATVTCLCGGGTWTCRVP